MPSETAPNHATDAREVLGRADAAPQSIVRELVDFLRHEKKWWLTPIIVVMAVVGALVMLGSTAAAPFLYTLF